MAKRTRRPANGADITSAPPQVKYPHVSVTLVGEDGNAFAILGRVRRAMTQAGCTKDQVEAYLREATAGDYDNLLRVTMRYVEVN